MCMKMAERTAVWRRERRVLLRVSRAAWRLEQAERERSWALASARAEGVSIRALAAAAGLSASRVHQIVAAADLDELDAALGELRAAGWPAPEDISRCCKSNDSQTPPGRPRPWLPVCRRCTCPAPFRGVAPGGCRAGSVNRSGIRGTGPCKEAGAP